MTLPNAERARVDSRKVQDYLLSEAHPVGRFKAAFFRGLGYERRDWEKLAKDLLKAVREAPAEQLDTSEYGTKYRIRCILSGKRGRSGSVDCIWIIGEDLIPRFITAYPAEER